MLFHNTIMTLLVHILGIIMIDGKDGSSGLLLWWTLWQWLINPLVQVQSVRIEYSMISFVFTGSQYLNSEKFSVNLTNYLPLVAILLRFKEYDQRFI